MTRSMDSQRPRRIRRQFTAATLVLLASVGWAQQVSATPGTVGAGPLLALAIDPDTPTTLYAVAGGVFKTRDAGGSWSALNTGLTNAEVSALAIDPKTPTRLYAVAGGALFAIDQVSACVGDCNDASTVTIDELLTMVNIALGNSTPSECLAGDGNQNGAITVEEILTAVNNALNGCGGG